MILFGTVYTLDGRGAELVIWNGKSSPGVWADLAVAPQRHELYTLPFHLRTLAVNVID